MAGRSGPGRDTPIPVLTVRETWERLAHPMSEPKPVLVDVREVWEFAEGHAEGAINIPLSEFRQRYTEVPLDRDALFICHLGQRSEMAARFLSHNGGTRVFNIDGGTDAWEAAGLPMSRPSR